MYIHATPFPGSICCSVWCAIQQQRMACAFWRSRVYHAAASGAISVFMPILPCGQRICIAFRGLFVISQPAGNSSMLARSSTTSLGFLTRRVFGAVPGLRSCSSCPIHVAAACCSAAAWFCGSQPRVGRAHDRRASLLFYAHSGERVASRCHVCSTLYRFYVRTTRRCLSVVALDHRASWMPAPLSLPFVAFVWVELPHLVYSLLVITILQNCWTDSLLPF